MNAKPYKVNGEKIVLIFDVHQDIFWVSDILLHERDADAFIFGGDYFDTMNKTLPGVKQVSDYLNQLIGKSHVSFCLGNHDCPYMEYYYTRLNKLSNKNKLLRYLCSGFSFTKAEKIAKTLNKSFWENIELFKLVNDKWLISHAGIMPNFWHPYNSPEESLDKLYDYSNFVLENLWWKNFEILGPGMSRGGNQAVGGITWADWNDDFVDELPYPQIVGHTTSHKYLRNNGDSWCLDCLQTYYGVIEGEKLIIKDATDNFKVIKEIE